VTLDAEIDQLYRLPPSEFTAARNALAKTLTGDDRARVRALGKPTNVAWAVNQVYWRDRSLFDQLVRAGEHLRTTQIAALKGRSGDVRTATANQRALLARAVEAAHRVAAEAGISADPDDVTRTLEALSMSPAGVVPGRLTTALAPSGFELLLGTKLPSHRDAPPARSERRHGKESPSAARAPAATAAGRDAERRAARARERAERLEARKREQAARKIAREREAEEQRMARARAKAEAALKRARAEEARARKQWEAAQAAVHAAEAAVRSI